MSLALDATSTPVGTLAEHRHQVFWEYDPEFVRRNIEISPYALPSKTGLYEHHPKPGVPIPGVFSDSRPDGWGLKLLHRRFAAAGRPASTVSPLDELAYLGSRTMGALRYEPSTGPSALEEAVELGALAAHAQEVYAGTTSTTLPQLIRAGGSPGGARPKALVGRRGDEVWIGECELPSGFSYWLVKFQRPEDDDETARRELAWMQLAQSAGLTTAHSEVLELGDAGDAFATRRFDRAPKQHLPSAAGALDVDFRTAISDYQSLARLTSLVCSGDLREISALVRLAMFNVVFCNDDDHLKNVSWCFDGARWALTPAYDLTYSPHPSGYRSTPVLGIDRDIPRSILIRLATRAGLAKSAGETMLDEVLNAAESVGQVLAELDCRNEVSQRAKMDVGANVKRLKA